MELWIRSQDKKRLTKVNDLYIVHDDNNFCDYIGNNMVGHVAKYTQQERALEVLDEISSILQLKLCSTLGTFEEVFKGYTEEQLKIVLKQMAVYEMPED